MGDTDIESTVDANAAFARREAILDRLMADYAARMFMPSSFHTDAIRYEYAKALDALEACGYRVVDGDARGDDA